MGDFIIFSIILWNKYMFLDNKEKILKNILLFNITLKKDQFVSAFLCLFTNIYILILASYIYLHRQRPVEAFYLQNYLWHKIFYDYLHQTTLGDTVQKITRVTITQSTNYGVSPAFTNNNMILSIGCSYLPCFSFS